MSNSFTVSYPGDKSQLVAKIKNMVGGVGRFAGDESEGSFEGSTPIGKFEGSYTINGNDITVTIGKKPFLVSNSRIREEFEKALKNV